MKEKYGDIKDKQMWEESAEMAEQTLKKNLGVKYEKAKAKRLFTAPKLAYWKPKNVLGKEDTIATVQVDFYSAKKFDLNFINDRGEKEHPVIIHRAIMGSFDRFFAFLVEKPPAISPSGSRPFKQLSSQSEKKFNEYGEKVLAELKTPASGPK